MRNIANKNVILGKIKQFYGFTTNKELASFLGVANNTITNWVRRNTIDYDLIFSKCTDVDINWLLSNEKEVTHAKIKLVDVDFEQRSISEIMETYEANGSLQNLFTYLIGYFNEDKEFSENASLYFKLNYIVTVFSSCIPEKKFKYIYEMYKKNTDKDFLYERFKDLIKETKETTNKLLVFENEINEMYNLTRNIAERINPDKYYP